jgi:hypothetical protein
VKDSPLPLQSTRFSPRGLQSGFMRVRLGLEIVLVYADTRPTARQRFDSSSVCGGFAQPSSVVSGTTLTSTLGEYPYTFTFALPSWRTQD